MNDQDVARQISQMVQFIKQEAEEKANEIGVSAEEEFNIEKLQMVEAEKQKIRKEYERKENQIEVKKKIEYSTQLNAVRIKVLQARQDAVQGVLDDAADHLSRISSSPEYPKLCQALILQGCERLGGEKIINVFCREVDLRIVQGAAAEAKKVLGDKVQQLNVSNSNFLPPAPTPGAIKSCCGGVVVTNADGKIQLSNTLDERLKIAFHHNMPAVRQKVFKEVGKTR
mmetsp:Transcript_12838/g.40589  ORF Transcript_12838/g.40589 Transcript_12838/m.40589 type:complete len:227 (-) Transcript_12838:253-933(-)